MESLRLRLEESAIVLKMSLPSTLTGSSDVIAVLDAAAFVAGISCGAWVSCSDEAEADRDRLFAADLSCSSCR